MLPYILAAGLLLLCVIAAALLVRRRKKRQAAARRAHAYEKSMVPVRAWVERVEAIDEPTELCSLLQAGPMVSMLSMAGELKKRYAAALRKIGDAEQLLRHREQLVLHEASVAGATDDNARRKALYAMAGFLKRNPVEIRPGTDELWRSVMTELEGLVRHSLDDALEKARSDRQFFLTVLKPFMQLGRSSFEQSRAGYSQIGIELAFPPDWNDMVARYIESPSVHDFIGVGGDQELGRLRLMAAEALRDRSLTNAKIVLAKADQPSYSYKGAKYPGRDEVGPVLLAELAKLVKQLEIELDLYSNAALPSSE